MRVYRGAGAAGGAESTEPHPQWESPAAGAGCAVSGLVSWRQRPCRTSALFAATNALLWFVAYTCLRTYSLVAALLSLLVVTAAVRDVAKSGGRSWLSMTASWEMMDSGGGPGSRTGPQLSDSLKLFLKETSAFKQQNPGKFCLLVCGLCTFLAVLGRYVPGIFISYILVLAVFLWPLITSPEVGLWLEPVLQKLDLGVRDVLQKIKQNHEQRMFRTQTDKDNVESDLSSMFPKLDSTVCREMSVSDTEVSDVTWTDNGTFNMSEGNTPQTENSEDLDKEEAFTTGFPEFPSHDNGNTTNGDDDYDLSLGFSSPQAEPRQPIGSQNPLGVQSTDQALELVNQMAENFIAAAVTAAIQERIGAAVAGSADAPRRQDDRLLEVDEDSDSEVEDFELLDQSELEQLDQELGLGDSKEGKDDGSPSTGFFNKLLRRH